MQFVIGIFFFVFLNQSLLADGIVESHLKWEKSEVSVCWGNEKSFYKFYDSQLTEQLKKIKEGKGLLAKRFQSLVQKIDIPRSYESISISEKRKVESLVKRHYTEKITKIHFTGWKDCKDLKKLADVQIFGVQRIKNLKQDVLNQLVETFLDKENSYYGASSIGMSSFKKKKDYMPEEKHALILKTQNEGTILHEFGHLAGLRHEHVRSEVEMGSVCSFYDSTISTTFHSSEEKGESASYTSAPDELSIMSYCYIKLWKKLNQVNEERSSSEYKDWKQSLESDWGLLLDGYIYRTKMGKMKYRYLLSAGDIHSLRCLYKDSMNPDFCYDGFNPYQHSYTRALHKRYVRAVTKSSK